jgi:hypothetical protein
MCNRHSFAVTPEGSVIWGRGLTDSHTEMLDMAGLSAKQHDACNLYEWQPPTGWPKTSWLHGLTVDKQVFEPKSSHDKAARAHLLDLYPTKAAWDAGDKIDPALHGTTIMRNGVETTVYCTGSVAEIRGNGTYLLAGDVTVKAVYDSARIGSVYGSARIGSVSGSARIGLVSGSARIDYVSDSASIDYVSDSDRKSVV